MNRAMGQPHRLSGRAAGRGATPVRLTPLMPVFPARPAPLKSVSSSTEILPSRFLLGGSLGAMIVYTMHLSVYIATSAPFLNEWMVSTGFTTMAMSPLVLLMGLGLISLLVLGGLWLKGRYPRRTFHQNKLMEKATELSSTYDYVTGLPTGRLFVTLLEQSIGRAAKTGRSLALLVVELEHFRVVAESQGQANSNVLVRVQAARVKGVLRSTETVARLAQDQFAIILDNLTSHEELMAIVEKLQATVGLPLTLDGHELFLSCRIGVALYPQDFTEPDGLIRLAVQVVKMAKSDGQTVRFASTNVFPVSVKSLTVATSLQTGPRMT